MAENRKDRHSAGYLNEYRRQNYNQFYVRVRKDSGIMEALQKMHDDTGESINGFIVETVRRKLIAEKYMQE